MQPITHMLSGQIGLTPSFPPFRESARWGAPLSHQVVIPRIDSVSQEKDLLKKGCWKNPLFSTLLG